MAIDEPERVWGFAEAAGRTAGGFGVLGKDDDGKREKLCVRETFRVRIWDASLTHFAETLLRLLQKPVQKSIVDDGRRRAVVGRRRDL